MKTREVLRPVVAAVGVVSFGLGAAACGSSEAKPQATPARIEGESSNLSPQGTAPETTELTTSTTRFSTSTTRSQTSTTPSTSETTLAPQTTTIAPETTTVSESEGTVPRDVLMVDFNNTTYNPDTCAHGTGEPWVMVGGIATQGSTELSLFAFANGDVTGDGHKDAVVLLDCIAPDIEAYSSVHVFTDRGNGVERLDEFRLPDSTTVMDVVVENGDIKVESANDNFAIYQWNADSSEFVRQAQL